MKGSVYAGRFQLADQREENRLLFHRMIFEFGSHRAEGFRQRPQHVLAPWIFDENLRQHDAEPRQLGLHLGVVSRQYMVDQAAQRRGQPIVCWIGRSRGGLNLQEQVRQVETLVAAGVAEGGLSAAAIVDAQLFEDAHREGLAGGDFAYRDGK